MIAEVHITFWNIIGWIVLGAIIGPIARLLLPGKDPMGLIGTIAAGAAGAFLGGILSAYITPDNRGVPWIASIIGGIIVVLIVRLVRGRSSKTV